MGREVVGLLEERCGEGGLGVTEGEGSRSGAEVESKGTKAEKRGEM